MAPTPMDCCNRAFPLLALPAGTIIHHVVPQLEPEDRLNFAMASRATRNMATVAAQRLRLRHCDICQAADCALGHWYPNVTELHITLGSIHDAMYSVPKLLLHARQQLVKLNALVIYDSMPDPPMDPPTEDEIRDPHQLPGTPWQQQGQVLGLPPQQQEESVGDTDMLATGACAQDHQWDWSHDLSSVILSVASTFPYLQRLTVRTLMMSDAECSAISLLTGLKQLSCMAEEGCQPGALASLTTLRQLRFLFLGDTDGNNQSDVETVCHLAMHLTRMAMGYCPRMQPPVLRSLGCRTDGEMEELEVNIDAEEGPEILLELAQLSSLKRLTVDSTDEFEVDPGFDSFVRLENLQGLTITMPMSLVNTQSLENCKSLRDLTLCTLPSQPMENRSLDMVTHLELLQWMEDSEPALFAAFPSLKRLILRGGADEVAMEWIGKQLSQLEQLHLQELESGYSRKMLEASAVRQTVHWFCSKYAPAKLVNVYRDWGAALQQIRHMVFYSKHMNCTALLDARCVVHCAGKILDTRNCCSQDVCRLPRLKELTIDVTAHLDMDAASAVDSFGVGFHALQHLCLSGIPATDEQLQVLLKLPELRTLRLVVSDDSPGLSEQGMQRLLDTSPKLQEVKWKQRGYQRRFIVRRNLYSCGL